jgi:hypothetical protein
MNDNLKTYLTNNQQNLDSFEPSDCVWTNIENLLKNDDIKKPKKINFGFAKLAIAASVLGCIAMGGFLYFKTQIAAPNDVVVAKNNKPIVNKLDKLLTEKYFLAIDKKTAKNFLVINKKTKEKFTKINKQNASLQAISTPVLENVLATITRTTSLQNDNKNSVSIASLETNFKQIIDNQKSIINNTPLHAEGKDYFNDFVYSLKKIEKDERLLKQDIASQGLSNNMLSQFINMNQQKINLLKLLQLEISKTNNRFYQTQSNKQNQPNNFILI